ncbi:MAG: NADH-quinone oxidoreductase subunit H [Oscillospiraceae bacterium]|nr:NADH-quinone oxidoreductase subunit H [Oscillospiraceae bacterium]
MIFIETLKFIIYILIFPGVIFISLFGFILEGLEEKVYMRMQQRIGSSILQPIYDFIKFSSKGITIPPCAFKSIFFIAPILSMFTSLLLQMYIPIFSKYFIFGDSSDIIFILILMLFPIISLIFAQVASGNRFSGLNISRAIVMLVSFSLPLVIIFTSVICKVNQGNEGKFFLTLKFVYEYQIQNGPLIKKLSMIPAALSYLLLIPAILRVSPFDMYDSNNEMFGGISSSFSGLLLGVVKFTKAVNFVIISSIFITLFFTFKVSSFDIINIIIFYILDIVVIVISVSFVKTITTRVRIEQAVSFLIKIPTILSVISLILVYFKL